ncbi:hypothetical protein DUI87_22271 [Hirundo rustica rustica]|uniref:Uncharacterized protein n=1 Tax=Hirundo rustica rustica TaxID=333673 RepID=A0A3M0JR00_HIRRU|nr:hypothetical protein DUI87_22271 [Hirundo rustica rustica]
MSLGQQRRASPALGRQSSGSHACETMGSSGEKALGPGELSRTGKAGDKEAYVPGGQLGSGDLFRHSGHSEFLHGFACIMSLDPIQKKMITELDGVEQS